MQYEILAAELQQSAYKTFSDSEAADSLNALSVIEVFSRRVNERDLLAEWGDPTAAEVFLQKLESLAAINPVIKRTLRWFTPDQAGIDAGHATTRAMLDQIVGAAGITAEEVSRFKALAEHKISRATQLGLPTVAVQDVEIARGKRALVQREGG